MTFCVLYFFFENLAFQVSSVSLFLQITLNQEFQAYLGGDDIREGLNGISYIAYVTTTRFFEVCVSANARAIICV